MRRNVSKPCLTTFSSSSFDEEMSRGRYIPPNFSTSSTSFGSFDGVLDVAITLCPDLRARSVSDFPKPDELPVMSQTRGWDVKVDILAWGERDMRF